MSRLQTPEASDPFFRVRSELRKVDPAARLRYSNQFAKDAHQRSHSCPDGIRVDDLGDFKLELVRRHNPHARRVCHIKGLNDVPVCVVRDELNAEWENRFIVSPGSLAPAFSKPKKKPFDKNNDYGYLTENHSTDFKEHNTPRPVTICEVYELSDLVKTSVLDIMKSVRSGKPDLDSSTDPTRPKSAPLSTAKITPFDKYRSRTSSRVSVPKMSLIPGENGYENDLNDELDSIQALDILCSILQTNSLQTVQAWIEQATDEERTVVLKALRDMKEKGLLAKPSSVYQNHLAVLPEDKVSVSYERKWNQVKSIEDSGERLIPDPAPIEVPKPPPVARTPTIGTQTPVSVLSKPKKQVGERPPTRIQMSGLSRPTSQMAQSPLGRPSTMRSVREKFMSGRSTATPAKDPGFSWTVKHRDSVAHDVISKA
ncbi:uncharacterized protein C4orf17 homolog isoform X2 [Bolinopsis microptera]|uniref:uncharacterized protein C4orf17 homolog isoform X2 n=1 Tax=Bolinopsis microptera TaxID=2820187 RepID=UPI00307AEB0D